MKKLIYIIFMLTTLLSLASCGARKAQVTKSEKQSEAKTEITDKGSTEKSSEAITDTKQATTIKEDEQVISEEVQTDYTANDPDKPIIEITGKDTVKIYNANKTVKTKKTTAKRQTDAQTTIDTAKQEKAQEKQQNDLKVKQEVKSSEVKKVKVTDKKPSIGWLTILLFIVVLLLLWWRRKKKG